MTTADDMVARLKLDPDSDIVAAMLVHELIESRGMRRTEADRHVARIRTDAFTAKRIERARAITNESADVRAMLIARVQAHLDIGSDPFAFIINGDDGPPRCVQEWSGHVISGPLCERVVALGAGWVIRWRADLRPVPGSSFNRHARPRRRK